MEGAVILALLLAVACFADETPLTRTDFKVGDYYKVMGGPQDKLFADTSVRTDNNHRCQIPQGYKVQISQTSLEQIQHQECFVNVIGRRPSFDPERCKSDARFFKVIQVAIEAPKEDNILLVSNRVGESDYCKPGKHFLRLPEVTRNLFQKTDQPPIPTRKPGGGVEAGKPAAAG